MDISKDNSNFATVEDLDKFWPDYEDSNKEWANELLTYASNYLRLIGQNNNIDLDKRKKEDETGIFGENLKYVTVESVKRAMTTPQNAPPADSWSQQANPYSETITFTDPSSSIYFKNKEYKLLGLSSISGSPKFGVVRGIR